MAKLYGKSRIRRDRSDYNGKQRTDPFRYCLVLGFFAGLIWGTFRWVLYLVHFTKVIPGFLADPFFRIAFLKTGWGHVVGIGSFIIFSIIATLLYKLLFGRLKGPLPGLAYGALWWGAMFIVIAPVFNMTMPINKIGYDTLVSEMCAFLLWGLFIGYSISFEYNDEASREPNTAGTGKLSRAGT